MRARELAADRVGMSQARILFRPLGYLLELVIGSEDAQWTNSYRCTVGLAGEISL
jgi:hypothetical protein